MPKQLDLFEEMEIKDLRQLVLDIQRAEDMDDVKVLVRRFLSTWPQHIVQPF